MTTTSHLSIELFLSCIEDTACRIRPDRFFLFRFDRKGCATSSLSTLFEGTLIGGDQVLHRILPCQLLFHPFAAGCAHAPALFRALEEPEDLIRKVMRPAFGVAVERGIARTEAALFKIELHHRLA